jgi:hypothetical protein
MSPAGKPAKGPAGKPAKGPAGKSQSVKLCIEKSLRIWYP